MHQGTVVAWALVACTWAAPNATTPSLQPALTTARASATPLPAPPPPAQGGVCNPFPLGPTSDPQHVTVLNQRFAVLYDAPPSAMAVLNAPSCCPAHTLALPAGWVAAADTEEARLAAKMFPFAADAIVFADGTAFLTVDSGLLGRPEDEFIVARGALLQTAAGFRVRADVFPTTRWGGDFTYCARLLITQAARAGDTDQVGGPARILGHFTTQDGTDYGVLDDTDPGLPWGAPGIEGRQQAALALPGGGWALASPAQAQLAGLGAYGCGCLVAHDGTAYFTTSTLPCATQALHTHVARAGPVYYWPSARLGSLRVLVTRPTQGVGLNTRHMKTLVLAPYSSTTNALKAQEDVVLGYGLGMLGKHGLGYDVVGVVSAEGGQSAEALDLEVVEVGGRRPKYHSVLLTSSSLSFQLADGSWDSGLPPAQWGRLRQYCSHYGVRTLSLFTYPGPRYGVSAVTANGSQEALAPAFLWFLDGGPWPLPNIYRVPCRLDPNLPDPQPEPVVYFTSTNAKGPRGADMDNVGGVRLPAVAGVQGEEVHFFFASSSGVPHGIPLGEKATTWLTEHVLYNSGPVFSTGVIVGMVAGGLALLGVLVYVFLKCRHHCQGMAQRRRDEHGTHASMADWQNSQSGY